MKNGKLKDIIYIVTIIILVGISWGTNATRISQNEEAIRLKANTELVSEQYKNLKEQLDRIEKKVDKLNDK